MMNKLLMGFLIAFIFFVSACSGNSSQSNQTTTAKAPVSITHISRGTISDSVSLSATTFYLNRNTITAPISGNITKVKFQQGDKVKKGQVLFAMQTREASALQSDSLSNLGKIKIRASSDGTIDNIYHSKGDFVQQGGLLGKIVSPDDLYLKLFIPLEYRSKISKNQPFNIRMPSGDRVSANFSRTLSQTDSSSQSLVWLLKPHQQRLLPTGLTFSLNIPTTRHTNTQLLPQKAVLANETLDSFWVMKVAHDSLAVKVPVHTGIETGNRVEILSPDFSPSDKIIISGQYGLEDSTIVQIQNGNIAQ